MNSRQKRKAWYRETHDEQPTLRSPKVGEFGIIPSHHYGDTRMILRQARAMGLAGKHIGSTSIQKIKNRIKANTEIYNKFTKALEDFAKTAKEIEPVPAEDNN